MKDFLNDLSNLPEPRKTYMEIMKVHQSEVHMANLLAFFFRSEEKHGLGNLFLKALLETKRFTIEKNQTVFPSILEENEGFKSPSKIDAETEFPAEDIETAETMSIKKNKKRIDILLEANDCAVCIEFKINHDLDNPLEIYQDHIEQLYESKKHRFYIVLTPFKKAPSKEIIDFTYSNKNKFSQIILGHFVKSIVRNLPPNYYINNSVNIHTEYLIDFIQTIQNREIRFKRSEVLKDIQKKIKVQSKYHTGNKGGFIQLDHDNVIMKIRFENGNLQVESWSIDNKFEKIIKSLDISNGSNYNTIILDLKVTISLA